MLCSTKFQSCQKVALSHCTLHATSVSGGAVGAAGRAERAAAARRPAAAPAAH